MKKFVIILGIIIILIVSTIFIINVTKFNNKNEVQMNVVNNVIPKENIQKEDNKNQIRQNYNNKEVGVKISNTNTWNDGISNYEQYNIELQNNYNSTLKNWSIELPIPLGASILQLWNANYKIDNNNLIISSEIYNNEIEANRNVELGFIAKTNNKFNTTNFKVIIDGEIVNNITENNSSKITTAMDNEIHKKSVIFDYVTDNIYENILKRIIKEGALNMQINQTPVEKYGKLSVNGTSLVDSKGKKVQLR